MKLIGKGLIIDATHGVDFPDYGDLEINFGLTVLRLPSPAATGGYVIPYDAPITGRIGWYDLNPALLAAVTGNSVTVGTVRRAEGESHAVPTATPFDVTLSNASNLPLSEVVVRDDNRRLKRVSGAPGEGEYAIAGNVLTFHSGDGGRTVYADYFYAEAAAGSSVVVNPYALPAEFKLLAGLKLFDTAGNDYAGELVLVAEHCRRTGPVAVGARANEFGQFGFEFAVQNRVPGDVSLHFS